jgi:hypothetical protein
VKPFGEDKTAYARLVGYTGRRKVRISDGRVISHGNMDWSEWLDLVHIRALRKNKDRVRRTGGVK